MSERYKISVNLATYNIPKFLSGLLASSQIPAAEYKEVSNMLSSLAGQDRKDWIHIVDHIQDLRELLFNLDSTLSDIERVLITCATEGEIENEQ